MMWSIHQKKSENVLNLICKLFCSSILHMHLACPFELLGSDFSLKEELGDHSLKRTFEKPGIQ